MAHTLKNIWHKVTGPDSPPPSEPLPPSEDQIDMPTFPAYDPVISEIYRHRRHIGVNLGSMFILEKWLCPPALCSCIISKPWESELDFLNASGSAAEARESLEQHWRTFVTESDFEWMQSLGINAVRIPIGYWVAGQDYMIGDFKKYQGVYDSAWARLLTLIDMAGRHNIGVLVDLHGAPGGQNGDTHCGISTHRAEFFNSNHTMDAALQALTRLAKDLAPINHVIGLEVLNEPIDHPELSTFYQKAYKAIRSVHPDIMLPIYFGDAWNMNKYSTWLSQSGMKFVVIDTHQYFCHMPADHAKSVEQHIKDVQTNIASQLQSCANNVTGNVVVGEWSVVLNGKSIQKSRRNDGDAMKEFGQVQQAVYDQHCAGWFYWNYRTGDDGWYWSFRYCVRNGIMPGHYDHGQISPDAVQTVQHQATAEKDNRAEAAIAQHSNYWSNNGLPNCPDFWRFQEGFQAGYTVALRFLASGQGSRIGFKRQLTLEYSDDHLRRHNGSTKSVLWHFEHGFVQGLEAIEQIIQQTIAR